MWLWDSINGGMDNHISADDLGVPPFQEPPYVQSKQSSGETEVLLLHIPTIASWLADTSAHLVGQPHEWKMPLRHCAIAEYWCSFASQKITSHDAAEVPISLAILNAHDAHAKVVLP